MKAKVPEIIKAAVIFRFFLKANKLTRFLRANGVEIRSSPMLI